MIQIKQHALCAFEEDFFPFVEAVVDDDRRIADADPARWRPLVIARRRSGVQQFACLISAGDR